MTEEFRCLFCGATSSFATSCITCNRPLRPASKQPPWLATRSQPLRNGIDSRLVLALIINLAIVGLFLLLIDKIGRGLSRYGIHSVAVTVGIGAAIVAWLSGRSLRVKARRALRAAPLVTITHAPETVIRIRGRARALRPTYDLSDHACIAFQTVRSERSEEDERRSVQITYSGGALFEVVDDDGARAVVRAENVLIANADSIHDGAYVEVAGHARWVAPSDASPESVGGFRNPARTLEIYSTPEAPIAIAEVTAPTRPSRTRVATEARVEGDEVERGERESAASSTQSR